jgi:3'(2'), 5'-bisphosphate nucleotidase
MDLISVISRIAVDAGSGIMNFRNTEFLTTLKSDESPVTQADLWANDFIVEELEKELGNITTVSEEGSKQSPKGTFWLIDPLDGTKEFINGLDDFTVNIAKIENGKAVLGVVHLPATGVTYVGSTSAGAYKQVSKNLQKIQVRMAPESIDIAVSRSHMDPVTEQFANTFNDHRLRQAGSSMKFCLIAEGLSDLYPRFGRTMEWDTAAGQAVLEAAGGRVLLAANAELDLQYGKVGFENPAFLALSTPKILH